MEEMIDAQSEMKIDLNLLPQVPSILDRNKTIVIELIDEVNTSILEHQELDHNIALNQPTMEPVEPARITKNQTLLRHHASQESIVAHSLGTQEDHLESLRAVTTIKIGKYD
jgi:hypothetical protein